MINGINSNGILAYSSIARTQQPVTTMLESQTGSTQQPAPASMVTISAEAYNALRADIAGPKSDNEALSGVALITDKIKTDPAFADDMAYQYSHVRDFEGISLEDLPPLDGSYGTGKFKTMDQYLQHVSEFERTASDIMLQRQKIYDDMKSKGASGSEIFTKLMEFNSSLPKDYLESTRLNVMVDGFLNQKA